MFNEILPDFWMPVPHIRFSWKNHLPGHWILSCNNTVSYFRNFFHANAVRIYLQETKKLIILGERRKKVFEQIHETHIQVCK